MNCEGNFVGECLGRNDYIILQNGSNIFPDFTQLNVLLAILVHYIDHLLIIHH